MVFYYVFFLSLSMVNVPCYWVVFVSFCLFVCYSVVDSLVESGSISWKIPRISMSKASALLPLHILFEPNQHMITKFTFMIWIIWWVTYSNTPNHSNLIPWSNLCIVLYFSSYAIATTLTLSSHSCIWYYCSKGHVIVVITIVYASLINQYHMI
jgi:hypothetical protein